MSEINRKGTENGIFWLEEETYKELYEKAKDVIFEMEQHYDYMLEDIKTKYEKIEELKKENKELKATWNKLMRDIDRQLKFQKSLEKYVEELEKEEKKNK